MIPWTCLTREADEAICRKGSTRTARCTRVLFCAPGLPPVLLPPHGLHQGRQLRHGAASLRNATRPIALLAEERAKAWAHVGSLRRKALGRTEGSESESGIPCTRCSGLRTAQSGPNSMPGLTSSARPQRGRTRKYCAEWRANPCLQAPRSENVPNPNKSTTHAQGALLFQEHEVHHQQGAHHHLLDSTRFELWPKGTPPKYIQGPLLDFPRTCADLALALARKALWGRGCYGKPMSPVPLSDPGPYK